MSGHLSNLTAKSLAKHIDHTLLKPEAKESDIRKLVEEALEYGFYSVCVEARWLPIVVPALAGSSVLPITVIGFPFGTESTAEKVLETESAVRAGAREIDMVLNRELLKNFEYAAVIEDVQAVVAAADECPVKVILEISELDSAEIAIASALCKAAGAAYVKTSTGFSQSGANDEAVALMRRVVGPEMGVKASGGIRDHATSLRMVMAGATRLGLSASVAIIKEAAERE
ncbi:MAG: deoxyribose-phosphate aldolase [Bdellovibrionota bacterium]